MLLKLHLLLRHSRRRRCLALWFRGRLKNECTAFLNWQCMFWVYIITFLCFFKVAVFCSYVWFFLISLCWKWITVVLHKETTNPQALNWSICTSLKLFDLKFLKFCFKLDIQNRKIFLEVIFVKKLFWVYCFLIFFKFCLKSPMLPFSQIFFL